MEKKLYKHQQRYMDERNRNRDLLVWEMQVGKTPVACEWIKYRKPLKFLVVCPKSIVGKWERELKDWETKADVVSRDAVKKIDLNKYDGLVLDEAQDFASPLFTKQRSARSEVIYKYVKTHPSAHILMLSATPIRSTSWNLHTLACFLGVFWPVKEYRDKFFYFTDMFGRWHYEPKKDWRIEIRSYLESVSDILLLKEVSDVAKNTHEVITIKQTENKDLDWHERHRAEQSEAKWKKLETILDGYRKSIVVVYYKSQIDDYVKRIGNNRQVFVLDGRTKNQDEVIEQAKASDDCVFILQASMGAGFSASETFSVMIFASMSFKYIDYVQATGRLNSTEFIHENNYIYLIGGKCDKGVYDTIIKGHDFNPHIYLKNGTSRSTKKIEQERSQDNSTNNGLVPF
jgi:superfamily II DNA or RNA helicase